MFRRTQNIYNFKSPKSGNEETGFFSIKGRITRKSFFLRLLFSFVLLAFFAVSYENSFFTDYESRAYVFFETIFFYILPFFLSVFMLIQGAKRMHDINRSGWYFIIPLYNIYLTCLTGTKGNNDYGIDPAPVKNIQFFDELESDSKKLKSADKHNPKQSGLVKWREHLNLVRLQNPNKEYQEILQIARDSYKSEKAIPPTGPGQSNKNLKIVFFVFILAIAAVLYYFRIYEPEHRDSDRDGIRDRIDDCPFEYGTITARSMGCPDSDGDDIADIDDACPDVVGNETNGCFYYKKVTFKNNSSKTAWVSIAYRHENDWISKGWFKIASGKEDVIVLPEYFNGKQVFWYAVDENGAEWTGSDRYFYVAEGSSSAFEVRDNRFINDGGGYRVQKGFYKIELTDENTEQGFKD